jgi:nicotinamidase-related amidase
LSDEPLLSRSKLGEATASVDQEDFMMENPTIRVIAGAPETSKVVPSTTALLVIDFQEEYFSGRLPIPNGVAALENAKLLIEKADHAGMSVFHVQHVAPSGSPIFAEDGETVAFRRDITPAEHHAVIRKSEVSVFQGTDIDAQLKAAGATTLIITGLMTHACVAGAARDAAPLGYHVIVAADASATRDLSNYQGIVIPHEQLHQSALVSLEDTFAEVRSTAEILGYFAV